MVTEALDDMTVIKSSAPIVGATFGVHPDIVFGDGLAIADVKYKLAQEGWNRPDLYEVVAFAAAFRCFDAALICFSVDRLPPRTVGVGSTSVLRLAWNCGVSPDSASRTLCESISLWIRDVKQNHGTTGVILCAGTAQQLTVAKVQALARLPAE
jgi:hypothetical protein